MPRPVLYNKKCIEGFVRYRPETEDVERLLYTELNEVSQKLSFDQPNNIEVKKTLKSYLLTNPFDLRGRRRLLIVLEMYEVRRRVMITYIPVHLHSTHAVTTRNTYQD